MHSNVLFLPSLSCFGIVSSDQFVARLHCSALEAGAGLQHSGTKMTMQPGAKSQEHRQTEEQESG
jgi:hypothetical protein